MSRISWLTAAAFIGVAAARRHAAVANDRAVVLSKTMSESLAQIAAPFLDKHEIDALVDLKAPKDQLIAQIDGMQKQIIVECNQEQANFDAWLAAKQADLYNNQQQVQTLQTQQTTLQNKVNQLQGQITTLGQSQTDLQNKLQQAQALQASYQKQLQDATDLRTKTRNQNLATIQQHRDSLQVLSDLRALVAALRTDSDTVMAKLKEVPTGIAKVDALVDTIKAELAQNQDPQIKADLKNKLLGLIDGIVSGIQESLNLYVSQETQQQQKFDNEIKPGLLAMIAQAQTQIDSLQAQLSQVLSQIGTLTTQLKQAQADLDEATNQLQTLLGLIQTLQTQIQNAKDTHAQKQLRCKADLDALETVRQFIIAHIQGMTPGNNCNPQSPNCDRCLYNDHCQNGQICTDDGVCGPPPTTAPPKQPYYQLLPKSPPTGWTQGRRVDAGIVPQSSFQLNDFTYIFKYQQLQPSNGWANLFNVLNVADAWPFPNQAALFLLNNMFEIDVCQDGLPWSNSYWYRNFYLEKVELNTWTAVAFVVSSSTKTVTLWYRDGSGKVRSQDYTDFHGKPQKFGTSAMGVYVNGRNYNSLQANFADFRRYDQALGATDVNAVFKEFFP